LAEPSSLRVFALYFVNTLLSILTFAIFGRAILSWFHIGPGNPFYPLAVVLHQITEPVLGPLRRVIPPFGMFDISPIVALLLLQVLQGVLSQALR
jgi:YggT family protein